MARPFRLERVLRLRTRLRKLIQDEVALLGASLARLREEAAAARQAQDDARRAAEAAGQSGLTGEELARWEAYGRGLATREASLLEESTRVAEALARGREELLERRREERKLERLRERAATRAQAEEARSEGLMLDDLALRQRAVRGGE